MILLARALHPPCFRLLNFGPNPHHSLPPPFFASRAARPFAEDDEEGAQEEQKEERSLAARESFDRFG